LERLSAAAHYLDIMFAAEQAQEAIAEARQCLVALTRRTSGREEG